MLLVPLVVLCVVAGLGRGQEQCWCTKSYQEILATPSLEAPTVSALPAGSCLNTTDVEKVGPWLRVSGGQVKHGYISDSGGIYLGDCQYFSLTRRGDDCDDCHGCCDDRRLHHHHHGCDHCRDHCCYQPVWSDWGVCSVTCGGGQRVRHCLSYCNGQLQQHDGCNTVNCPVWSYWGVCSVTCGGGQRVRHCLSNCNGHLQQHDSCNTVNCPVWSAYSQCSVTCGSGTQARHCENHCHALQHTKETRHCQHRACTPVWSAYGACSVTCGVGIKTRHCLTNCDAVNHSHTQICHTHACLPVWSAYGACSVTCGGGIETRHCLTHCDAVSHSQTRTCHTQAPCLPVWSDYGVCSVTCGSGIETRHCLRNCGNVNHFQTQDCHRQACLTVHHATEHTCDKLAVVEALALYTGHKNCTDTHARHSETFVAHNCGAPSDSSHWVRGKRLYLECNTVAPYTPVATFDNSHLPTLAGVFVGCEKDASLYYYNLKIATSVCGGPADLLHVSTVNDTYTHFYTILW